MREKKTVKAKVVGEERLGSGKRLKRVLKQENIGEHFVEMQGMIDLVFIP